jgi:uncharacterized Tic20 family protein
MGGVRRSSNLECLIPFLFVLFWKEGVHRMERSQEEKILAGLSHVALLFSWIGLVGQVVLLVLYREKSRFVFGHAKQAIALWVVSYVVSLVINMVFGVTAGLGSLAGGAGLLGGALVGGLIALAWLVIWVVLLIRGAVMGFKGAEYRQPLIGDMVARIGE